MRPNSVVRAIVLLSCFAVVNLFAAPDFVARAQTSPGDQPGIVASGYGRVSGPASLAEFQVLISQNYYYGGMGYSMEVDETIAVVDASPVASDGFVPYPDPASMMPPRLTEGDLAPFIDAIVASGVEREGVRIFAPAAASNYTAPSGLAGAQLRFEISQPSLAQLSDLASNLVAIITPQGAAVEHIGVHYVSGDCTALEQEARVIAIADAKERAAGLAAGLGVELGDLIQAADGIFLGPYGDGGCDPSTPDVFGAYGPGMLQAFDASVPAEAVAYAQVTLTYDLKATE
jgi:hypothetical protein